ncbi:MAG: hypothetical protein AAB373_04475 [Patescibacteria group bacterium]
MENSKKLKLAVLALALAGLVFGAYYLDLGDLLKGQAKLGVVEKCKEQQADKCAKKIVVENAKMKDKVPSKVPSIKEIYTLDYSKFKILGVNPFWENKDGKWEYNGKWKGKAKVSDSPTPEYKSGMVTCVYGKSVVDPSCEVWYQKPEIVSSPKPGFKKNITHYVEFCNYSFSKCEEIGWVSGGESYYNDSPVTSTLIDGYYLENTLAHLNLLSGDVMQVRLFFKKDSQVEVGGEASILVKVVKAN